MADWFVRPNTSHSGSRTGTSYANAWGGWTEIVWGGAGVVAGDTLYVCDSHTYSAILTIGLHGATVGSRVTVRGDYAGHPGVITFTTGAYYIDANRNYMTFTALTISAGDNACISPGGIPLKGLWITNCTFSCGAEPAIKFRAFNTWAFEDCIIDGNTFTGGTALTLGGCIQWYVTAAVSSTMKRLTIRNNTFTGNTARATILLRANFGTALDTCSIEDLIVYGNTFQDCNGVALESECRKTSGAVSVGANFGIKIYDNVITNQGLNGILGGGFSLTGFELSTTPGFGHNDIYNNWCSGLHGLTGFCNPMWGTYRVFNNYAENITTIDIDGCGVLFDHGAHDCVAFGNEFRDIHGKPTDNFDTGFGILILDAERCDAYGNLIVNCLHGVAFGNKTSASSGVSQSSNIYNNTFVNCAKSGAYLVGGADNTTNIVRNNIFTTTDSAIPSVKVNSAAWTGESNNCLSGFGAPVAHTLATSSKTSDPQLDTDYRPQLADYIRAGVYLGGTDFYGKRFHNPPNIGGVNEITATPRYRLKRA